MKRSRISASCMTLQTQSYSAVNLQNPLLQYSRTRVIKQMVGGLSVKYGKRMPRTRANKFDMTAQQLNRPINEIAATLIHEMCHQYASINKMLGCSRSGQYHNKLFKRIAKTHGLKVECVDKIGWSHTELTDTTAIMIADFVKDNPPTVIYCLPVMRGQTVKTSSTRKYICPI